MTEERRAQIAAGDPTFVPGAPGQGKKRAGSLGGKPGRVAPVSASELVGVKVAARDYSMKAPDPKEYQRLMLQAAQGAINEAEVVAYVEAVKKGAERLIPEAMKQFAAIALPAPGAKLEIDAGTTLAEMMRRSLGVTEG